MTLRNMFGDLALEATADQSKQFQDTLLQVLVEILDKMPRLTREGRLNVAVSDTNFNEINGPYYGVSTNNVGEATTGKFYSRINEPWHFSNASAAYLYNNITVS